MRPCKHTISLFFLCLVLINTACRKASSLPSNTEESAALFHIDDIPEITVEVTPSDWNTFLHNYDLNSKNEEYVPAKLRFSLNGVATILDSIGLKLRGNTSRRRPEGSPGQTHQLLNPDWHHSHFALDFSRYKPKQQLKGLEKMILKFANNDPSYVREIYGYDLFRRFGVWTAPRASYCRVTVKVSGDASAAYYGVYYMIENGDSDFVKYRKNEWGATVGYLWKCLYNGGGPANLTNTNSIGIESVGLDPNASNYYTYDLKTNKTSFIAAKAQLSEFISQLNSKTGAEFETWIAQKMDVNLLLKTFAVSVLTGNWDDYWGNGNNYFLYFNPNGKVYYIPYDYDNSLGTAIPYWGFFNTGTQDPLNWGKMNESPLITKVLQIAKYREQYKAYIKELATKSEYFNAEGSMQRIATWQGKIAPYISNATGEDMSIVDLPAPWSTEQYYRLLSGNELAGQSGPANYFKTRISTIPW
ncbi:MAG: CotH kinase family protein [Sphingobacteriaceae bacterium]